MPSTEVWYLENIIDYAGTFPPAALPVPESWANYRRFQTSKDAWILGSLAIACTALDELGALLGQSDDVEIAVIGRPSNSWETWVEAREADIAQIKRSATNFPGMAFATYESRIADLAKITESLQRLKSVSKDTDVYIELPWDQPLDETLAEIATHEWARVKFRTGGLMKESFPSCDQLATVIKSCVDLEIEFKLTAGLHEPIAHLDRETGAHAHGFLNVLAATAIAYQDDASEAEISQVLANTNAADWKIGEELTFAGQVFDEDTLNNARSFFGSFGSCSIDEPLDGLGRLTRGS